MIEKIIPKKIDFKKDIQENFDLLYSAINKKNVLIIGGAGTIGLETAKAFSQLGANILLVDNNKKLLDLALSKLTAWDKSVCCDITDKSSAKKVMEAAIWNFGGLDILVSNAGNASSGELIQLSNKKLRESFELNFFAHQSFAIEAAKILEIQGRGGQIWRSYRRFSYK